MSMPIQRQSDTYGVFDDGLRFAKEYTTRDLPEGLVNALGPRGITAGLNDPRRMAREAAWENDYGRPGPAEPPSASAPDATELREREQERFDRHYGPGAETPHYTEEAFTEEPHTQLQPLHQLLEEYQTPLPPEPHHDYLAQFRPHMASFTEARHLEAEDGGPAPSLFTPMLFQPGPGDPRSTVLDEEKAWVTAAAMQPQVVPGWVGHGYAPGHRVGLPWRETVIPGTVTHLDGQEVGVRWDDGQHSTEEPSDLRPL